MGTGSWGEPRGPIVDRAEAWQAVERTTGSTLHGIVRKMIDAGMGPEAREVDRVLLLLRGEGWSGFMPADEALAAIIEAGRPRVVNDPVAEGV